jgi:hypothetical protein
MYQTLADAMSAYRADAPMFEEAGVFMPGVRSYTPEPFKRDVTLAIDSATQLGFDAQVPLNTAPNSSVLALFTTMVDPAVYRILFAASKAATILGEVKKGDWTDETIAFPTVEYDGETTAYGDFDDKGHTGANVNWPQRQAFLFQTIKEYGEREVARQDKAKINWISELDQAATTNMKKFENTAYFFGIAGLQNFGLVNDPALPASLTPATKTEGGVKWLTAGGVIVNATEIYNDIEAVFIQLVAQTAGLVDRETPMCLALSPQSEALLTATNSFNVNVSDLLKKNFPNLTIISAVQYGALSATNPQGFAGGNFMQLIAKSVEGQDTGFCAYNVKGMTHPIIRGMSSFRQKQTGGVWGAILRQPFAIASMLGI